jgi:hypothetical protein
VYEIHIACPQTKVRQTWKNRNLKDDSVPRKKDLINEQAYWVDENSAPSADVYSTEKDVRFSLSRTACCLLFLSFSDDSLILCSTLVGRFLAHFA